MASASSGCTSKSNVSDVVKLLNKELHVAQSDIQDAITDYFSAPISDAESENESELSDVEVKDVKGESDSVDNQPLLRDTVNDVQNVVHQICAGDECDEETTIVTDFIQQRCKCSQNCVS